MIADLLRDFVREDWRQDLDFSTLEKVPGSYVTPELRSRESDVVWRVRWGSDRRLYVYLLIELQSTVDPLMALRMMVYLGPLYQDPPNRCHPLRRRHPLSQTRAPSSQLTRAEDHRLARGVVS
jgi:hypothetical protein